ncbi:RNA polymerase subunit sigma, partial [Achromobacter xylosoxidans]|nr:RNA polymerase subunit sigma [Achromobacter xylosoxidans]
MSSTNTLPTDTVTQIYREHHGWLSAWLRKKLGNSFDAADLAHDTFLR